MQLLKEILYNKFKEVKVAVKLSPYSAYRDLSFLHSDMFTFKLVNADPHKYTRFLWCATSLSISNFLQHWDIENDATPTVITT